MPSFIWKVQIYMNKEKANIDAINSHHRQIHLFIHEYVRQKSSIENSESVSFN